MSFTSWLISRGSGQEHKMGPTPEFRDTEPTRGLLDVPPGEQRFLEQHRHLLDMGAAEQYGAQTRDALKWLNGQPDAVRITIYVLGALVFINVVIGAVLFWLYATASNQLAAIKMLCILVVLFLVMFVPRAIEFI